nr:MAG TPA: hypothetical protein [Caudoviricetes sp.]
MLLTGRNTHKSAKAVLLTKVLHIPAEFHYCLFLFFCNHFSKILMVDNMLFFKNIIALKNLDTTVKCHFGRISNTEMFFIRENHIFHTGLHLPDNVLSPFISPAMSGKTGLELVSGRYGTVLDPGGNSNCTHTILYCFLLSHDDYLFVGFQSTVITASSSPLPSQTGQGFRISSRLPSSVPQNQPLPLQ